VDSPDRWLAGLMGASVDRAVQRHGRLPRPVCQPDKAHTPWGGLEESAWSMRFWDLDTAMASLLILQVSAYLRNLLT
jgi:hypothetical protein